MFFSLFLSDQFPSANFLSFFYQITRSVQIKLSFREEGQIQAWWSISGKVVMGDRETLLLYMIMEVGMHPKDFLQNPNKWNMIMDCNIVGILLVGFL